MDIHPKNTQDNVAIDQGIFNNIQINSFRQMVDNINSMKVKKIGYKRKKKKTKINFFIFRQFIIDTNKV